MTNVSEWSFSENDFDRGLVHTSSLPSANKDGLKSFSSQAQSSTLLPNKTNHIRSSSVPKAFAGLRTGFMPSATDLVAISTQGVKKRRRRESHNLVERRRRDNINERIIDLGKLVPQHRLEDERLQKAIQNGTYIDREKGPNKGEILTGAVYWMRDLMWMLNDMLQQNEKLNKRLEDLGQATPTETSDDERRMRSEFLGMVSAISEGGKYDPLPYSRSEGTGLRVPGFTDPDSYDLSYGTRSHPLSPPPRRPTKDLDVQYHLAEKRRENTLGSDYGSDDESLSLRPMHRGRQRSSVRQRERVRSISRSRKYNEAYSPYEANFSDVSELLAASKVSQNDGSSSISFPTKHKKEDQKENEFQQNLASVYFSPTVEPNCTFDSFDNRTIIMKRLPVFPAKVMKPVLLEYMLRLGLASPQKLECQCLVVRSVAAATYANFTEATSAFNTLNDQSTPPLSETIRILATAKVATRATREKKNIEDATKSATGVRRSQSCDETLFSRSSSLGKEIAEAAHDFSNEVSDLALLTRRPKSPTQDSPDASKTGETQVPPEETQVVTAQSSPNTSKTKLSARLAKLILKLIYSGKVKLVHFLGSHTTAWFVLVCATAGTAITSTQSVKVPLPPESQPGMGDTNYYTNISSSIVSVCSLYYLFLPFLRGEDAFPVRVLFYIVSLFAFAATVTAPAIYVLNWQQSIWCTFGSGVAQVAATALLFENVGSKQEDPKVRRYIESQASNSPSASDDIPLNELDNERSDATSSLRSAIKTGGGGMRASSSQ